MQLRLDSVVAQNIVVTSLTAANYQSKLFFKPLFLSNDVSSAGLKVHMLSYIISNIAKVYAPSFTLLFYRSVVRKIQNVRWKLFPLIKIITCKHALTAELKEFDMVILKYFKQANTKYGQPIYIMQIGTFEEYSFDESSKNM